MKNILIAAIVALGFTASAASALDLPIPGLELNTEVVAEYKVDAETATLTSTPELAYSPTFVNGLTATAGIEIDIWSKADGFTLTDQFEVLPEVLLGVTYVPGAFDNLELEVGTAYDFEASERDEITITATFNF
jgi:hypothetical protein